MQIAYHIGAHCTDDDRLIKSLLRNRDRLDHAGTAVPGPGRYRAVLRDVITKLRGAPASADAQDVVMDAMLDGDAPRCVVLSNPSFISVAGKAVEDGELYPRIFKAAWLRAVFPDNPVSFHMAIRNPATFIPALFAEYAEDGQTLAAFLDGADPETLRWSDAIARLAKACPDCEILIWCNEDLPLIFDELMRAVAHVPQDTHLHGGFDALRDILTDDGMKRLRAYCKEHPPATPVARRRIVEAFLAKFGIAEEIEEVIDLPGWTVDMVGRMTSAYEADLARISALPRVTLLTA